MNIERTRHMAIALRLFENMPDKQLTECFDKNSAAEVRAHLKELRAAGYEYYPSCDDCDEKGLCRGHGGKLQ